jgi:preprotein translocase subunit SecE
MKIGEYIKGTQAEMRHVNWPSKEQTTRFTVAVVLVSAATAILLGVSDFTFSKLLTLLF